MGRKMLHAFMLCVQYRGDEHTIHLMEEHLKTAYDATVQHWVHAEETRWSLVTNYFTGSSILLLTWAAVFTSEHVSHRKLISGVFALIGLVISIVWAVLAYRSNAFVIAYREEAAKLETKLAKSEAEAFPFHVARTVGKKTHGVNTRATVVVVPLLFAAIYLILIVLSLSYAGSATQPQVISKPEPATNSVSQQQTTKAEDTNQGVADQDASKPITIRELPPVSVTKDWMDEGYWIFNFLLVVVGFLQVWVVFRTLGAIRQQAETLKGQKDSIDKQAGIMERQSEILKESVAAAKDNAEAAKNSVEMLISKERARLRVDLKKLDLTPKTFSVYTVDFVVSNAGPTAAFIVESGSTAYFLPLENIADPNVGDKIISTLPSLPKVVAPNMQPLEEYAIFLFGTKVTEDILSEIKKDRLFIGIRGFIRYNDVFDRERVTKFRYVWKYSSWTPAAEGDRWGNWEKCGAEEENSET